MRRSGFYSLLAVCVGVAVASDGNNATDFFPRITLLSAVPTPDGPRTFPAQVYGIDESTKRLRLIREIASADEGVDSVRSYGDTITIDVPHIQVRELRIIHGSQPEKIDNVVLPQDGFVGANAIALGDGGNLTQAFLVLRPPEFQEKAGTQTNYFTVTLIESATTAERVKLNSPPSVMATAMITGMPGGSSSWEGNGIYCYATKTALLYPSPPPHGTSSLASSPPDMLIGKSLAIMCSDEAFLVIEVRSGPTNNEQLAYVYNRSTQRWSTLKVPGSRSRLRIFGEWMTVIVMNDEHFKTHEYTSGTLLLINLLTNTRLDIHPPSDDNEVLSIAAGHVLYRTGNTIQLASISNTSTGNPTVAVQDNQVQTVHWATMIFR